MLEVDLMEPFIDYIQNQKLPSNKTEAEHVSRKEQGLHLSRDKLYK